MNDRAPHHRHSDDARADDGLPTDAVTDEVREDAAQADLDAATEGSERPDAARD